MNYKDYNDYELIYMIRENNDVEYEVLFKKYEPLIKNIAGKYISFVKNNGGEFDDLVQEGFVSLNSAINSFDENKGILFYTLANVCIERGMQRYCKKLSTKKNLLFNSSINIDSLDYIIGDSGFDPSLMIIDADIENDFLNYKNLFSFKLSMVFELKYNGFTHQEISKLLDISISVVNKRLCKIRSKIREICEDI